MLTVAPKVLSARFQGTGSTVHVEGLEYCTETARQVLLITEQSISQRIAGECLEELKKVLNRVDKIYGSYEQAEKSVSPQSSSTNIVYASDLIELEGILKNDMSKRQYKQQVTVFIVGYEELCSQRLKLIQQVNEFLLDHCSLFDNDLKHGHNNNNNSSNDSENSNDSEQTISSHVQESISTCLQLSEHLGHINHRIAALYDNLQNKLKMTKNKRKVEQALDQAKKEALHLNSLLLRTQEDLKIKETNVHHLTEENELRNAEIQKYRITIEAMKKSLQDFDSIRDRLIQKDQEVQRLQAIAQEYEKFKRDADKMNEERNYSTVESYEQADNESKNEMKRRLEEEINTIESKYLQEIDELKGKHEEHLLQLQQDLLEKAAEENQVVDWLSKDNTIIEDDESQVKSAASNKLSRSNSKLASTGAAMSREGSNITTGKDKSKSLYSQKGSRKSVVVGKISDGVTNEGDVLDGDLSDHKIWSSLPESNLHEKFTQYRKMACNEIDMLKKKVLSLNTSHNSRANDKLLNECKRRWKAERELFILAVHKSEEQRKVAQQIAEAAVSQMEEVMRNKNVEQTNLIPIQVTMVSTPQHSIHGDSQIDEQKLESVQIAPDLSHPSTNSVEVLMYHDAEKEKMLDDAVVDNLESIQQSIEDNKEILKHNEESAMELLSEMENIGNDDESAKLQDLNSSTENIIHEFENIYLAFNGFRKQLMKILEHNDDLKHFVSQLRCEEFRFDHNQNEVAQVEKMSSNLSSMLSGMFSVMETVIISAKHNNSFVTRESSQLHGTRISFMPDEVTVGEASNMVANFKELEIKYDNLKFEFDTLTEKCKEDSINNKKSVQELQALITSLKSKTNDETIKLSNEDVEVIESNPVIAKQTSTNQESKVDSTVIFTRKDFERNSKILKQAVLRKWIDESTYEAVIKDMVQYTNIPALRLAVLVKKYMDNNFYQKIEDFVKNNHTANAKKVLQMLDKMETLKEKRSNRYVKIMDFLRQERISRAQNLCFQFFALEDQCSIFLIKPILSLGSKNRNALLQDLLVSSDPAVQLAFQEYKKRVLQIEQDTAQSERNHEADVYPDSYHSKLPAEVKGSQITKTEPEYQTFWNPVDGSNITAQRISQQFSSSFHTPKLLEIDINRLLVRQNTVSTATSEGSCNNYLSMTIPGTQNHINYNLDANRSLTGLSAVFGQRGPPCTPLDINTLFSGESKSRKSMLKDFSRTPALPPIVGTPR